VHRHWTRTPDRARARTRGPARNCAITASGAVTIISQRTEEWAMRQPPAQAPRQSDAPRSHPARPRPAGQQSAARAACGHTRYTKGCDICALAGIYHDHLSQPGITPAQRSEVIRLYQAGDKASLFKLWQSWRREISVPARRRAVQQDKQQTGQRSDRADARAPRPGTGTPRPPRPPASSPVAQEAG